MPCAWCECDYRTPPQSPRGAAEPVLEDEEVARHGDPEVIFGTGASADSNNAEADPTGRRSPRPVGDQVVQCVVCLQRPRGVYLRPCGHVCTCAPCAARVTTCPLCRCSVAERLVAFV